MKVRTFWTKASLVSVDALRDIAASDTSAHVLGSKTGMNNAKMTREDIGVVVEMILHTKRTIDKKVIFKNFKIM